MGAKWNLYKPGKSYGPFTIKDEIGIVMYNNKKMPQFNVVCRCGHESVKTRDQLANSERKAHQSCIHCKKHGAQPNYVSTSGRTCAPRELIGGDIGKLFIAGAI